MAFYHEELGLDPADSHVTVFGMGGPHNVNDHYGRTGEEILLTIAGTLASPGANNFYLGGQPVVVIGPEHAEVIAADGFSKMDVNGSSANGRSCRARWSPTPWSMPWRIAIRHS